MAVHPSIADIRKVYEKKELSRKDVDQNPVEQFKKWWEEALASNADEANAMTLATCSRQGKPSARIVLLKGIHENGFVFFSNYNSRKAAELEQHPFAALLFFWKELERQVRIEGRIEKLSASESDEYFSSRPRESQLGAWTSPQSKVIPSREFLQKREKEFEEKYVDTSVPRPPFWGGYLLIPEHIEYWQGRPGRLHDRILYSAVKDGWKLERLAP